MKTSGTPNRLIRRFLPDTVVGRTALVLVVALLGSLAAILISVEIQRSAALMALGVRDAAEKVAGFAHLLEEAPPEGRRPMLRSMDTPGFRAGWGSEPLVNPGEPANYLADTMAHHLRERLDDHEIRVSGFDPPPDFELEGPGLPGHGFSRRPHPPRPGFHRGTGFGPALKISVRLEDGSWFNVFAPLRPPEPFWRPDLLVPMTVAILAVVGAALLAVWRAARPFAVFAAAAEHLGVDVNAPAMTESGPREVRRAAHAFNVMQRRIRRFVEDRTQMLAAISHDLRTPITRMKLRAEFVEDEGERVRMLADLDEMERMIAATMVFARDDPQREERRVMDVAALIQGLVDDATAVGAEAEFEGPANYVMMARPLALKRALANLLDNALKYGKCARVKLQPLAQEVRITIADEGPGIPEADRERVFSPFVRLETSRSRDTGGTGLGLSIARAAIRAHGGDIQLAAGDGGGLVVSVLLPAALPRAAG